MKIKPKLPVATGWEHKNKSNMIKSKIVEELTLASMSNYPLVSELRNLLLSEEAKRLKQEDLPTFCNLLAFYNEAERYYKEIGRILARLGKSCNDEIIQ